MPEGLLELIMSDLDITWIDEATKKKLTSIIKNGIKYFDEKSGIQNDYITEGRAQSLLFNYVKYARDGLLYEFEANYRKEIIAFINKAKADRYAESQRDV